MESLKPARGRASRVLLANGLLPVRRECRAAPTGSRVLAMGFWRVQECGAAALPFSPLLRGEGEARLAHVRGERRSRSKSSTFGRLLGAALGVRQNPFGDQSGVLPDRRLDLCGDVRIGLEKSDRKSTRLNS